MRTLHPRVLVPLLITIAGFGSSIRAVHCDPIDYTTEDRQAIITDKTLPQENRVIRMALGIGRSSDLLSAAQSKQIYEAIVHKTPIPAHLNASWQRLLRIAQVQAHLEASNQFFPVGYEFEAGHSHKNGWEDFDDGLKEFKKLVAQNFGVRDSKKRPIYKKGWVDDWEAEIRDDAKRTWPLVSEYVAPVTDPDDNYHTVGWELVTPPFRKAEDLQGLASLRISLGNSKYGRSTPQTGLHQTSTLVPDLALAKDEGYLGRVAANLLLLKAQFAPARFKILDVRRNGAHKNLFMRPMVLDHGQMLNEIQTTDPKKIDVKFLNYLMNDKYIDKEFAIQVEEDEELAFMKPKKREIEKAKMLEWSKKKKAAYKWTWKYRDEQLKFIPNIPEKILSENRIGDYVDDRPEMTMVQTLLDQQFLKKANELAAQGKIFQLQVPERMHWMDDDQYWEALRLNRHSSVDAMLDTVGIDDPNIVNLIKGRSFVVTEPKIEPSKTRAYAFEGEAVGESLTHYIVPRDPDLRKKWRDLDQEDRVTVMERMGFKFGEYNPESYRVLTTEFTSDLAKFPFMSPDLHVEASGNWEIKSSPRAIPTIKDLEKKMTEVYDTLDDHDWIGFHMHEFVPKQDVQGLKGEQAKAFAKNMERRSLSMALTAYSEADKNDKELDYLDSWSLDRYSPKDIQQIEDHLNGKVRLDSIDQKFHNVAFRPMGNVLDLEARDLEEDIGYGINHLKGLDASIENHYFGDPAWNNDPPIFNEFRDHANLDDVKQFTLEGAVSAKYKLTEEEKSLLHKMQFEISRPIMGQYVYFEDFSGVNETPSHLLDTKYIRTNFENNVSLPLFNYDEQSFLSKTDKAAIAKERDKYVARIYDLLKKVEKDPKYAFLKKHDDFLYLADYLERSTHPTRPNFFRVNATEAKEQRKALRKLVDAIRSETIHSIQESDLASLVGKSLPTPAEAVAKGTPASSRPEPIEEIGVEKPSKVLRAYIPEEAALIELLCKKANPDGKKIRVRVRANSGRSPSSIENSFEIE